MEQRPFFDPAVELRSARRAAFDSCWISAEWLKESTESTRLVISMPGSGATGPRASPANGKGRNFPTFD